MPFKIATATASFRRNTEDRLALHHVPGGVVVVVADGAGGIPGGGEAADLVLKLVERALGDPHFNPFSADSWANVLGDVDGEIERDRLAGETTAVVVAIADGGPIVGASCGDSGALMIGGDGQVDDLTAHQKRKKRLGSGRVSPVPFERPSLSSTLIVATDGLLAFARPDVISRVVANYKDLDKVAQALIDAVRLRSGDLQDDVAVVLVRAL